jgi:hypothetical protein
MQTGLFGPQNERRAFQRASEKIARALLFFFTLYIQNSILQWVFVSRFANLYLPCHQQLAHFSIEFAS